jgi:hypothetical protein
MQFTLPKLFLTITMAALACAGMAIRTRGWAESILSFSILLYIAVAILAFRGGGQVRAFRIAFAAVGGGYLLLVLCNTFTPIRDLLVTNRALILAGQALHISAQAPQPGFATPSTYTGTTTITPSTTAGTLNVITTPGAGTLTTNGLWFYGATALDEWDAAFGYGTPTPNPQIPAGAFLIIGHCLSSWLLALAAGCFAAFVCRPRAPAVA